MHIVKYKYINYKRHNQLVLKIHNIHTQTANFCYINSSKNITGFILREKSSMRLLTTNYDTLKVDPYKTLYTRQALVRFHMFENLCTANNNCNRLHKSRQIGWTTHIHNS